MGFIYKLTSPSGKSYIGLTTKTILERWKEHVSHKNVGSCRKLNNAIKCYGAESFVIIKLLECDDSILGDEEKRLIAEHNTLHPNGYNIRSGGNGNYNDKNRTLKNVNEKISKTLKGQKKKMNRRNDASKDLPRYIYYYKDSKGCEGYKVIHAFGKKTIVNSKFTMDEKFDKALEFLKVCEDASTEIEELPMYISPYGGGYMLRHPKFDTLYYTSSENTREKNLQLAKEQREIFIEQLKELNLMKSNE
ncbi:hypothetical protein BNJ_00233 [Kaumoebavirus]|uniref:hypothetical protein n=1 Tax=Kaumoebavirus TaxID=1859492 RepID=UPI0009C32C2A|nr:hypothetical protein BNJ_00233 [Kaumoebavirus]ARA72062.1 hypothetical protein BNJ_00233 [Kaumoebavirus]